MTGIIKIGFHGDELWAVKDEAGRGFAVLRRMCEMLGLALQSQLEKLKGKPWATVTEIVTVAEDGKNRATSCLDVESVPMWLATIDSRKVSEAARPMLLRLQCEARDVLARHFLRREEPDTGLALVSAVSALASVVERMDRRLDALEHRDSSTVSRAEGAELKRRMLVLARKRVRAGLAIAQPSSLRAVQNRLGVAVGWFGKGCAWDSLPVAKLAEARRVLVELESEVDRALKIQETLRQVVLFPVARANLETAGTK